MAARQPAHAERLFALGNACLQAGQYEEAISAFDALLQADPADWQALANRAQAHYRLKHFDLALEDYYQALTIKPDAPSVLSNFGVLLKELGQLELAEALLRDALKLNPELVDAWSNLGVVLQYQLRYAESVACHRQAIRLHGANPELLNNLGNACTCSLELEPAISAFQQALELDPNSAVAAFNLSITLFLAGRYEEAWPLYEARWNTFLKARLTERRWQGEALDSQRLLLWSEQGLGDTLQMVRFLSVIQQRHPEATILLACPRTFHRLFQSSLAIPLCDIEGPYPAFDWQIPLMSVPGVLGMHPGNLPTAPYLKGQARPDEPSQGWSTATLRVGIVWETGSWGAGIADHSRQNKSVPFEQFAALLARNDVQFVSLQLGDVPAGFAGQIQNPELKDFADTAAVVEALDLVISVDTSVAHLAGAQGKPVWVMMRYESAPFFMASGEASLWYPSMRIFRQEQAGDWSGVIHRVMKELDQHSAAKKLGPR